MVMDSSRVFGAILSRGRPGADLVFLFLKTGLGFVSFIGLFLFATALSLVQSPVHYPTETEFLTVNDQPITWVIDTAPELALAVVLGVVLLLVCFHLANALAAIAGRVAVALLDGPTEPARADSSDKPAPAVPPAPDESATDSSGPPASTDNDDTERGVGGESERSRDDTGSDSSR